jgi:hypothetical protein
MNQDESDSGQTIPDGALVAEGFAWPRGRLDEVAKMRAIAAALPYCAVRETVLHAPFDRVWNFISDVEGSTPLFEGTVSRLEILERNGEHLRIRSRSLPGLWFESRMVLRPGWCLMHSRVGQVGMAARAEGDDRTRFIHFEGSPLLGRLLRPYLHWNIGGDFRRLAALLE